MHNWKDIPIPPYMKKLPKDKRGYPIPVTVMKDDDGRPHFQITDQAVRQLVLINDLCGICGRKLTRFRALVGGPKCALHPQGAYSDPPMHLQCAEYALQVCPYLAVPKYLNRINEKTLNPDKAKDVKIVFDENMLDERPEVFLLVLHSITDYITDEFQVAIRYAKPRRPYERIDFWKHGKKLPNEEVIPIVEKEGFFSIE